mmetsp:Transcript_28419/g.47713  ORF Transcript_28419/g.47713 Transcript_28419/m.47713 type:complete len:652 (+) Transcript_28419:1252-3207(+)
MGGSRLGEQQAHRVTLVPEGGLHANEDVAVRLPVHEHILPIGVEVAGRWPPVLLQRGRVVTQARVLLHAHLVLDVQLGGVVLSFLVVKHALDEPLLKLGHGAHIVAFRLKHLQHLPDGAEYVEVGSGPHVALVRREGEHGDAQLLLRILLLAQGPPLDGAVGHSLYAVVQRVRAPGVLVAPREDDRLHATVQLGQGHLEGDLHRVQAEGGVHPLLRGLEHQRDGHHVGHVQALQGLHRLRGVLLGRASDERETGEGHDGVHKRLARHGVVVEAVQGAREVQTARENGHNLSTLGLHLLDDSGVVALVAGDQMRALQHEPDHHCVLRELRVLARVVPVQVLLEVLVHARGRRVPDPDVGEHYWLLDLHVHLLESRHVLLGEHQQEVLQVFGGAAKPVLEGLHEVPRVLGLVGRKVLQHLREGADKLEETVLEAGTALGALLLHEGGHRRLGLPDLRHGEGAELVHLHHLWHGREHQHGVHAVAVGRYHLHNLIGELLDEDEGGDKHVGLGAVSLELLEVGLAAEFLEKVAGNLEAKVFVVRVDGFHRGGERRLVLSLQYDVHELDHSAAVNIVRRDSADIGVGVGVHATRTAGDVLDLILSARFVGDRIHGKLRGASGHLALQASADVLDGRPHGEGRGQRLGNGKKGVGAG